MRTRAEGGAAVLVTATSGQRGSAGNPPLCQPEELAACRESELRAAAAIIGFDEIHLLGYQDKELAGVDPAEIRRKLVAADPPAPAGRRGDVRSERPQPAHRSRRHQPVHDGGGCCRCRPQDRTSGGACARGGAGAVDADPRPWEVRSLARPGSRGRYRLRDRRVGVDRSEGGGAARAPHAAPFDRPLLLCQAGRRSRSSASRSTGRHGGRH